jgi:hypothetical protein
MYGRFILGLPGYLRRPITLEEARDAIRRGLLQREENFLRVMRRGIFENPRSPYRPLLELAHCDLGDVESTVRSQGLEATLRVLKEAGVYLTFEEYKGRKPVIRNGTHVPVKPEDFNNPYTARAYTVETGGTTSGSGTRVNTDLEHLASTVPHLMLVRHIHGLMDAPMAIWRGPLPDPTGVGTILRAIPYRGVPHRWFSPIGDDFAPSLKNRLATAYIIWMARFCGIPCPKPEPLPLERAEAIAEWAAETAREHGSAMIGTSVSLSVRICVAAHAAGIDLSGVAFMGGGEPVTAAKVAAISRVGARFVTLYISSDMGPLGLGCAAPEEENDQHLLEDCVALIQHPREVLDSGTTVDAFYFTSLRPAATTILLNVESDDYGIVERRSCGCPFEDLGYELHLLRIRSFGKLTGEGVTLVGSEMTQILEKVLPERFGGSPLDYQLVEEEDETGLSRLILVVSPRVETPDDDTVIETLLAALGESSVAADLARALWKQADTFQVRHEEPEWTTRGKLRSLRVGRRAAAPAEGSSSENANKPTQFADPKGR